MFVRCTDDLYCFAEHPLPQAAKDMDFEKAAECKADLMELSAKYDDPDL